MAYLKKEQTGQFVPVHQPYGYANFLRNTSGLPTAGFVNTYKNPMNLVLGAPNRPPQKETALSTFKPTGIGLFPKEKPLGILNMLGIMKGEVRSKTGKRRQRKAARKTRKQK